MGWSIPIPATTVDQAVATAQAGVAAIDVQLADTDVATREAAHAQADVAIDAVNVIAASGVLGPGLVSGLIAGYVADPSSPYTTVAVQLSCAPDEF